LTQFKNAPEASEVLNGLLIAEIFVTISHFPKADGDIIRDSPSSNIPQKSPKPRPISGV